MRFLKIRLIPAGTALSAILRYTLIALGMTFLLASAAEAQVLQVIVRDPGAVGSGGQTGSAPFDALPGAGNDTSATDHVIRTLDQIQYDWNYSVNGGAPASNVVFTSTLPTNPSCGASGIFACNGQPSRRNAARAHPSPPICRP
jgi:hypothetical protein